MGDKSFGDELLDKFEEVIVKVSGIQVGVEHMQKTTDGLNAKVDILVVKEVENAQGIKAAHRRLDEIVPVIQNHQKKFDHLEGAKMAINWVWVTLVGFFAFVITLGLNYVF